MTSSPLLRLESHIVSLVTEASVTITRVEVRRSSSTGDDTADAGDDSDVGDSEDGNDNSDLDEDCDVDVADLAHLLRNWT